MRQALIACLVFLGGSAAGVPAAWLVRGGVVWAQQPAHGVLREIVPGHYVYSTTTFNSGVIATSDGVVILDFINDGYGLDWLKALDAVEALDADIFIPGHGPIPSDARQTRQDLRRFRQMLVDVRDAVQTEIARGATEDQAAGSLQWPQYATLQGYDAQRETAVRRLYRQLTGRLP